MKPLALLLLSLVFATGSCAAGPVEEFCAQFAGGAEVRVYRGFPQPAFARDLLERAKKAGCVSILGEVFYPETKTLNEKDAATWLARATNPDSYYPLATGDTKADPNFHADIAFWCVTPDHKNQTYCLVSFATSQVQVASTDKGVTVAMTLELEKLCREILQRTFEQELKEEKTAIAGERRSK
jgi:hypothetical protein